MYREDQSGGSFMLGVLTGAFVGAGLALLFAPRTGPEMRAQLGEQYRGLADRVGEQAQSLRSTAGQWREQGRERVQQLSNQLSDRMSSSSSMDRQGTTQTTDADRFPSSAPSV
jgi:gas vesicle protein